MGENVERGSTSLLASSAEYIQRIDRELEVPLSKTSVQMSIG
jgi:hypothetical protein